MATRKDKNGTVTIYDIATQLGVGKTTVSLVLSGRGKISSATRTAVLDKARELGFRPNPHAQRLAQGRSDGSVFLFIENLYPGTGTQRADLIQTRLREHGYEVPLYTYGGVCPPGNVGHLMSTLCWQQPRAIIYHGKFDPPVLEALRRYHDRGGVVVCYAEKPLPPFDTVGYDYDGAACQAVHHLLQLGHRDIGLYAPGHDARYMGGIHRTLQEAGTALRPECIIDGYAQEEGGVSLANRFLALDRRPTALCVINDASAMVFINQVMRAGLQVPRDVSVVGFDDTVHARNCIVPLTTVRQPVEQIAAAITAMVITRIESGCAGPASHQEIRGQLVVRESCAAAP